MLWFSHITQADLRGRLLRTPEPAPARRPAPGTAPRPWTDLAWSPGPGPLRSSPAHSPPIDRTGVEPGQQPSHEWLPAHPPLQTADLRPGAPPRPAAATAGPSRRARRVAMAGGRGAPGRGRDEPQESYPQRQDHELQALEAIYGADFQDLRPDACGPVGT